MRQIIYAFGVVVAFGVNSAYAQMEFEFYDIVWKNPEYETAYLKWHNCPYDIMPSPSTWDTPRALTADKVLPNANIGKSNSGRC